MGQRQRGSVTTTENQVQPVLNILRIIWPRKLRTESMCNSKIKEYRTILTKTLKSLRLGTIEEKKTEIS